MKTQLFTSLIVCLLLAPFLQAESVSTPEDAELLRQEIRKQEIVIQALKEKLERIEESENNFFAISISTTGLRVGEQLLSAEELEKKLHALPDDTRIKIRVESTVKHKKVTSVIALCAKAELTDITFTTIQAGRDRR